MSRGILLIIISLLCLDLYSSEEEQLAEQPARRSIVSASLLADAMGANVFESVMDLLDLPDACRLGLASKELMEKYCVQNDKYSRAALVAHPVQFDVYSCDHKPMFHPVADNRVLFCSSKLARVGNIATGEYTADFMEEIDPEVDTEDALDEARQFVSWGSKLIALFVENDGGKVCVLNPDTGGCETEVSMNREITDWLLTVPGGPLISFGRDEEYGETKMRRWSLDVVCLSTDPCEMLDVKSARDCSLLKDGDRHLVVTKCRDNALRVFDAAATGCLMKLQHDTPVLGLKATESGDVFSFSQGGEARLWNRQTGVCKAKLKSKIPARDWYQELSFFRDALIDDDTGKMITFFGGELKEYSDMSKVPPACYAQHFCSQLSNGDLLTPRGCVIDPKTGKKKWGRTIYRNEWKLLGGKLLVVPQAYYQTGDENDTKYQIFHLPSHFEQMARETQDPLDYEKYGPSVHSILFPQVAQEEGEASTE